MRGKDKGVVALVSKAAENDGGSKPLVLHCIIHQQSLCRKCLDMSEVLKPVISTVNFIRSFGLNHQQFLEEIGENDLPYHTAGSKWFLHPGPFIEKVVSALGSKSVGRQNSPSISSDSHINYTA
ncbi:general transcription factor II-I repeat domain-containing protein 2 [Trichonephila clavata]|uniref:General transcription factor II-I repeat domain-containing protein 2 n=1 Tax=Trichonephila clavata TaxID=2740835 RepID=A0A8X6L642_TRICU|nr:general transcription factor II-I repeat domain-containing protein 2 [Trichonephila clavata]